MPTDAALREAMARAFTDRRYAWEGKPETVTDFGDALLRAQGRAGGTVARLALDPGRVEARLDELIEAVEGDGRRCLWIVGPDTRPGDLGDRLTTRGFARVREWAGLALTDLRAAAADSPAGVTVEPLSWANAAAYAAALARPDDERHRAYLLACAHRYLGIPERKIEILVARLDGAAAGYAVLWAAAGGVAMLADALTVPAFRRRGVYRALVARRLALARAAGCTAVVTYARTDTSAPILARRGFRELCRVAGYLWPRGRPRGPLRPSAQVLPDDDLLPLLERLGAARLVGLGEATHGDRESFLGFRHFFRRNPR